MLPANSLNFFLDCRFALPALLPLITPDLHLSEQQGALLTAGYAVSTPSCVILSVPKELLHKSQSSQPHIYIYRCIPASSFPARHAHYSRHCMSCLLYIVSPSHSCVTLFLSTCAASEAGLVAVAVCCSPDSHWAACRPSEPAPPAGRRPAHVEPPHHDWLQGKPT